MSSKIAKQLTSNGRHKPKRVVKTCQDFKIVCTHMRNLGTKNHDEEKKLDNFVKYYLLQENEKKLASFTSTIEVDNRGGYMVAFNNAVTPRSLHISAVDKDGKVTYSEDQDLATFTSVKGCVEEFRCIKQTSEHTFFMIQFGQSSCRVTLNWHESNEPITIFARPKDKALEPTLAFAPNTTTMAAKDSELSISDVSMSDIEDPLLNAVAQLDPFEMQNSIGALKESDAYQCTNALVLVPWENQSLWNAMYSAMKEQEVIKNEDNRIIVRWTIDPFNIIVVNVLAYNYLNLAEVRVAISCSDNVVFLGNSMQAKSCVLTQFTHEDEDCKLADPLLDPKEWGLLPPSSLNNVECNLTKKYLALISDFRRCYALLVSNDSDDYPHVPHTIWNQIIPLCKATALTPELYTCWKFTGLKGRSVEEYRCLVNAILKHYNIPAAIDIVCYGCVAVIMHGPSWLWWFLTAFQKEISRAFGSDLRSITQIGVNNVTELMKRKDNERFRASLSQLRTRMISHNVPACIQNKLSIVFESSAKKSTLSCVHSKALNTQIISQTTVESPSRNDVSTISYPQEVDSVQRGTTDTEDVNINAKLGGEHKWESDGHRVIVDASASLRCTLKINHGDNASIGVKTTVNSLLDHYREKLRPLWSTTIQNHESTDDLNAISKSLDRSFGLLPRPNPEPSLGTLSWKSKCILTTTILYFCIECGVPALAVPIVSSALAFLASSMRSSRRRETDDFGHGCVLISPIFLRKTLGYQFRVGYVPQDDIMDRDLGITNNLWSRSLQTYYGFPNELDLYRLRTYSIGKIVAQLKIGSDCPLEVKSHQNTGQLIDFAMIDNKALDKVLEKEIFKYVIPSAIGEDPYQSRQYSQNLILDLQERCATRQYFTSFLRPRVIRLSNQSATRRSSILIQPLTTDWLFENTSASQEHHYLQSRHIDMRGRNHLDSLTSYNDVKIQGELLYAKLLDFDTKWLDKSFEFIAPKVLDMHYNQEADIFSFGICLLRMTNGEGSSLKIRRSILIQPFTTTTSLEDASSSQEHQSSSLSNSDQKHDCDDESDFHSLN